MSDTNADLEFGGKGRVSRKRGIGRGGAMREGPDYFECSVESIWRLDRKARDEGSDYGGGRVVERSRYQPSVK